MRFPSVHEACFSLAFDRSARLAAGVYCFRHSTATTAWNNIFVIGLTSRVVVLSGLVWSISTFGSDCLHSFSRLIDEHIKRLSFLVSGRSPMVCLSVCVSFLLSFLFCQVWMAAVLRKGRRIYHFAERICELKGMFREDI
jgi:uncharacterized protein involved in cysteine biosynthesis